jgi:23S rRNA pseudouridine2605 synthase
MVRRMTDIDKTTETDAPDTGETAAPQNDPTPPKGERIAKVLARAGVASRREIERMIEDRRIAIDGKPLDTPATLVTRLKGITVDGNPITEVSQTKLWRFHKKRGTLTTHRDPEGRKTVFDQLPAHMGRVISVGRLDMNTEGLLLFTNDGELARWLELPANQVVRKYRVRVYGRADEKALAKLKDGATIDGVHYGAIEASLERQQGSNGWISVAIREGKNREVRKVMEHLGLTVNRLIRTHYGPFSLGTLDDGNVAPVGEKQLYEVLSEYFGDAPQAMGTDTVKRDPSKWAKAKKDTKVKPGAKRRRQFKQAQDDAPSPGPSRRPRSRHANAEDTENTSRHPGRSKLSSKPGAATSGKPAGKPSARSAKFKARFEDDRAAEPSTHRQPTTERKGRPPKGQERALTGSKGTPDRASQNARPGRGKPDAKARPDTGFTPKFKGSRGKK